MCMCVCVCVCVIVCMWVCVVRLCLHAQLEYDMIRAASETSHLKREILFLNLYYVEDGHNCNLTIV